MATNGIHSIEKNSIEKKSIVENSIDNIGEKKQENKKHFAEFVSMTNAEYEKLVSTYGKDFANQCIVVLDNYKGANGKKYKSDYRAILNWVIDRVKQDNSKNIKPNKGKLDDFIDMYNQEVQNEQNRNNTNNNNTSW